MAKKKASKKKKASSLKKKDLAPRVKASTRKAVSQEHRILKKAMEKSGHIEQQKVPEYKQLEDQNRTFLEDAIALKKLILRK